jgi:hypothetical protein
MIPLKKRNYFLHSKDGSFSKFKKNHQLVKANNGCIIKALQSEEGGEYISTRFVECCCAHGIKRETTTSHTPQQKCLCQISQPFINWNGSKYRVWE